MNQSGHDVTKLRVSKGRQWLSFVIVKVGPLVSVYRGSSEKEQNREYLALDERTTGVTTRNRPRGSVQNLASRATMPPRFCVSSAWLPY